MRIGQPIATSTDHRPDIDGLRAVAVLSVLFYHAGIFAFPGGFVGVDIFFVISGFLITRLLVNELQDTGRLDLRRFYLRRARRLLPAFFFALVIASFVASWRLSPGQLESYGASLFYSVISVSNIWFYSESGYFDAAASIKPLLHTWSLGVEEQFYLVWPLLLGLLASRKLPVCAFVIAVGLASLVASQALIAGHPDAVFYLMPFRMFELSLGAALVFPARDRRGNEAARGVALLAGIALIGFSVFTFSQATRFPAVNALVPCMGAVLCIYGGDSALGGKVLGNEALAGIGLISYSLYLAHWPMMVFYRETTGDGDFTALDSAVLVAASVTAAVLMYLFVEQPFRSIRRSNTPFLAGCALLALLIACAGASMWAMQGWGWRSWANSGHLSVESVQAGKKERFKTAQEFCRRKKWQACDDAVPGAVNALIVGDSQADDALNAFAKIYPGQNFAMSTLPGCPPHRDIEKITLPAHPKRLECKALNARRFDPGYLRQFDYIVIDVLQGWYTAEHLLEYLEYLRAQQVRKVVVVGEYFELKREMYELVNQYGYNAKALRARVVERPESESLLRNGAERLGYLYLSARDVFCGGGDCELFDRDQVPFTYDRHHLSVPFAVRLGLAYKAPLDRYLDVPRAS